MPAARKSRGLGKALAWTHDLGPMTWDLRRITNDGLATQRKWKDEDTELIGGFKAGSKGRA